MSDDLKTLFSFENTHREPATKTNAEEFAKVVRSRRSVRKFSADPVPEETMKECLELALLAPNSSNLQPWEFHWVRNPSAREPLNKAFLSQPAATTAPELVVAVARTGTWKTNAKRMIQLMESQGHRGTTYYKKIVPLVYGLGFLGVFGYLKKVLFFLRGLGQPTPREMTDIHELRVWAVKTTALACENLMLALRAHGYDRCPMEGYDSALVAKILNLPSDAVVVMGVSAGKRADDGVYGEQVRFPSEEFIKEV